MDRQGGGLWRVSGAEGPAVPGRAQGEPTEAGALTGLAQGWVYSDPRGEPASGLGSGRTSLTLDLSLQIPKSRSGEWAVVGRQGKLPRRKGARRGPPAPVLTATGWRPLSGAWPTAWPLLRQRLSVLSFHARARVTLLRLPKEASQTGQLEQQTCVLSVPEAGSPGSGCGRGASR